MAALRRLIALAPQAVENDEAKLEAPMLIAKKIEIE
jgi:hypothetical protein